MTVQNDCKEAKQALRTHNKRIRKEIYSCRKNMQVVCNLRNLNVYKNAKNILAFYPLANEINLKELFEQNEDNKNWFLPKMVGTKLLCCPYEDEYNLVTGQFNVKEPTGKIVANPDIIDMIILPALASDRKGNRLGYGKGCYDSFLANINSKTVLVLPIFKELIVDSVPTENFDKKVHIIVTDEEIIFI